MVELVYIYEKERFIVAIEKQIFLKYILRT